MINKWCGPLRSCGWLPLIVVAICFLIYHISNFTYLPSRKLRNRLKLSCIFIFFLLFFKFNFIFKLYVIVLVLPTIKMNPPQEHMYISCIFK